MSRRAGLIVQHGDQVAFVPAELVQSVRRSQYVENLPGSELGMSLIGAAIVPVLRLSPEGKDLLLCELDGELVGFVGLQVECSGFFESSPAGVRHLGRRLLELDLRGVVERARWRSGARSNEPEGVAP